MLYEYRDKNPKEDTNKPNQATSKEDYMRRQVRITPEGTVGLTFKNQL